MINKDFIVIAITSPEYYPEENMHIYEILETGDADFVHIRKPLWTLDETAALIQSIPKEYHPKLKIHDHFELLKKFDLGGIHLNSRNVFPVSYSARFSKSCHSLKEILNFYNEGKSNYDYVTLSPIFDSISKPGYKAAFDLKMLSSVIKDKRVIALGGVTPSKFPILKDLGFAGAALLGYFFPPIKKN